MNFEKKRLILAIIPPYFIVICLVMYIYFYSMPKNYQANLVLYGGARENVSYVERNLKNNDKDNKTLENIKLIKSAYEEVDKGNVEDAEKYINGTKDESNIIISKSIKELKIDVQSYKAELQELETIDKTSENYKELVSQVKAKYNYLDLNFSKLIDKIN